ncbi:SDR family NAD(P)-dependent oxidoreductase [Ruegeria sp. EL01]|uniref:SDR family NAD(P)-dependent oxidoreductase n=1 Tax=Ruegeria sp. EL01 TaxID=2107578 RepID=UPI0013C48708|nr:SDR family NAD(P)-dependent oxidoreductase [Ruegeria sp. EL01]
MEIFSLAGKTALVTGASRGIGRATALRMAEAGAKLLINSRTPERCQEVVDEIRATGGEAIAVPHNISKEVEARALAKASLDAFGGVDIFVGNAAANPYYGPALEAPMSAIDKIIDTSIKSNLVLCQELVPGMKERKDGSIILVTSIAGVQSSDGLAIYGMSKAAEASLVRSLATELGCYNIRANAIAPGLVRTDFARGQRAVEKDRKHLPAAAYRDT